MRLFVISVALVALAVACSKGAKGFDSPEAGGKALVDAVTKQDAEAIKKLFPPDEVFKAAVECKETKIHDKIKKERGKLVEELGKDLKGIKMEWVSLEERKTETMEKGKEDHGCTFKDTVTMKKVKLKFKMTKGDKTEEETEGVRMMKFGDAGWFLVDM